MYAASRPQLVRPIDTQWVMKLIFLTQLFPPTEFPGDNSGQHWSACLLAMGSISHLSAILTILGVKCRLVYKNSGLEPCIDRQKATTRVCGQWICYKVADKESPGKVPNT